MNYADERKVLCEYGLKLVEKGLVARTWGNLSVRLGEDLMLITPSGRAYETAMPEEMVPVRISTLEREGTVKPSSEKELHARVYRLRPDVGAIFHTHQPWASALAAARRDFAVETPAMIAELGIEVPCAAYALPTTKKLAEAVERVVRDGDAGCRAILLANHGAVCLGRDPASALRAAEALEAFAREAILDGYRKRAGNPAGGERELIEWFCGLGTREACNG